MYVRVTNGQNVDHDKKKIVTTTAIKYVKFSFDLLMMLRFGVLFQYISKYQYKLRYAWFRSLNFTKYIFVNLKIILGHSCLEALMT